MSQAPPRSPPVPVRSYGNSHFSMSPGGHTNDPPAFSKGSGVSLDYVDARNMYRNEKGEEVDIVPGAVGLLPGEVYDRQLYPWVAVFRRKLQSNLVWESDAIASMQRKLRTPFLDAYFVNTSSLGTHTFFMTLLPAFCFFGYHEITQGLIFVLALGVYASSFLKDMVCSPRPFSPPVTRLTIGNHHLEYGFPSTHSTNSVSIALFFFTFIHRLAKTPVAALAPPIFPSQPLVQNATDLVQEIIPQMKVSQTAYWISAVVLLFYVFSIVYGRLYTGMHSFTDCAVGVLLGTAIWVLYVLYGDTLDFWLKNSGWIVPAVVIPFCLLLVNRHPEPVDDCPCFEDAIAFMSVVMGDCLTRWHMSQHGYDHRFFVRVMPGKAVGTFTEMWAWWTIAVAKLVVGILTIFAWRIFAKFLLHRILPPTFRFLAQLVTLPHRRYYTPATDYTNVPQDKGLRAIPSVLDLPGMFELEMDGVSTARAVDPLTARRRDIKLRNGGGRGVGKSEKFADGFAQEGLGLGIEEMGGKEADVVKHYDADVLTKVVVYCGIGMLASGGMPIFFEVIGWGMRAN